jgi:hypothetical protein
LAQRYEGETSYVIRWDELFVNTYCGGLANGTETGTYTALERDAVQHAVSIMRGGFPFLGMVNSVGMVIGSEKPWVECLALNAGAKTVWTFEYGTIVSTHPRLKTLPYKTIAAGYESGTMPLVDWVISYSSLEHSGLGRYGDALNPEGDREAMEQIFCMLKPGGLVVIGVPCTCKPIGFTQFNAHRVYGYRRLAYIAAGFELVRFVQPCSNPENKYDKTGLFMFRKPHESHLSEDIKVADFEAAAAAAR